jgi:hypothetical protein
MENKNENNDKKDLDIQVVLGDDSNLEISDVSDCVNTLRPKDRDTTKKAIIIPKAKNEKK